MVYSVKRIGLYNIDKMQFPNYALMKISSYHKAKGDSVAWYSPVERLLFDKVYCSSVFTYSDKSYVTDDMVCGGSGFDLTTELPKKTDECKPDYSIYPECDYSIVWFDIGCFRNCPFCINNNNHQTVNRLTLNLKGKYIKVQDDTFFYGDWNRKIEWLKRAKKPVEIQNVDARIFTEMMANSLLKLKHNRQIKMAWDNPKEDLKNKFIDIKRWINPSKIMVYVLIGYWSTEEEDLYRVMTLKDLGFDPFVMPYNKHDFYQRNFERWVNMKAVFKTIPWKIYYKNRFTNDNGI